MSLPTFCRLTFVLSVFGAVAAIRFGMSEYIVPFAYLCLVCVLIGLQLPEDEQMGQAEER